MKDKADFLIDITARNEGGGSYTAWTPNDNGHGVSAGLIQFNQKVGSLPKLLRQMFETDPVLFRATVSLNGNSLARPELLLDEHWVRSTDLNDVPVKGAILRLLQDPNFQQCQRDLARTEYLNPAYDLAKRFGLTSERAVALCFDTSVQHGVTGLERLLKKAVLIPKPSYPPMTSPDWLLRQLTDLADRGLGGEEGRRHQILKSSNLSDETFDPSAPAPVLLRTLRLGDKGDDVEKLSDDLSRLGYLHLTWGGTRFQPNPNFTPSVFTAVKRFQRDHNLIEDGIVGVNTRRAIAQEVEKLEREIG